MASLTKIKKTKRRRRDSKKLLKRQKAVKKLTSKAREKFNEIFS